MSRRQRRDLHTTVGKQTVGSHQERFDSLLHQGRKGIIDLAIGAGIENFDLPAKD
jgi:hypothetical protein